MFAKRGVAASADRVYGARVNPTRTLAWLGIVSVIAVAATGCFAAPSSANNATPSVESDTPLTGFADCNDGLHRPPWECATLDVPLDRDDPASGSITLTVFAIPHTDESTPAGAPLFATPGGPGARGIDNYALWLLPAMVRAHHDVVSLDPRGTGTSAAIDCPGLANGSPTVDAYVAAVAACGEQLGTASDLYGGAQRAMDVEALRKKMGYEQIIFYGGSYGGVDVQAYAARYPERLAGLIIDGGFIVDDPDTFFGTPFPQDAVAAALAAMPDDAFAPWSKAGWRAYSGVDQCLGWPAPSRRDPILTGTASITGIPALLLVGANDPGRALAPALTTRFPDAPLIVVPYAGHPSLEAGQCIAEYTAEFVETLTVPAGTPCT